MAALLSVFPAPLARLILRGGAELPWAFGELHRVESPGQIAHLWDPRLCYAHGAFGEDPLTRPERWAVPLAATSPWPARLARVAAWMLRWRSTPVDIEFTTTSLYLQSREGAARWNPRTGKCLPDQTDASLEPDLPTLPNRIVEVRYPVAALPLALFDLPELKARVEGAL